MIAYNKNWLDALNLQENIAIWTKKGLLSKESEQNIFEKNKVGFYSPKLFVCIGLGLFGMFGIGSAISLLAMVFLSITNLYSVFSFCCGVGLICILEFVINKQNHYRSGMDNVLLYAAIWAFIIAFTNDFTMGNDGFWVFCVAFPLFLVASIRYLDRLATLGALISGFWILVLIVKGIPNYATALMPFVGMNFACLVYFFSTKMQSKSEFRFWKNNLITAETFALILFYLSGNYYIINTVGKEMFGLETMPIPWFFWTFTFLVPVLYVFFGLKNKNRLLLDFGLIGLVASIFTYRNYYSVLPLEWAAVIGGSILLLIAYFSIKYLKKNTVSYTFSPDAEQNLLMKIQEQAMYQSLGNLPQTPKGGGTEFGGGAFGGGGAGGEF
jgi:uncharacterized membrane protein YgcG